MLRALNLRLQGGVLLARGFHSSRCWRFDFAQQPLDKASLRSRIQEHIIASKEPVTEETTISALVACSLLENQFRESSKPGSPVTETPTEEARELLRSVLKSENVHISENTVRRFVLSKPFPMSESSIEVIKRFNEQNPTKYLPLDTSFIPFRRAAYGARFDQGLKLIDITVGKESNWSQFATRETRKLVHYWAGSNIAVLTALESLFQSGLIGTWQNTGLILTMVATYISAVCVYAYIAFAGRSAGVGEVLEWMEGTTPSYKYRFAAEMKMSSILAAMNRSLPENANEVSLELLNELKQRQMKVIEDQQETFMKEYWARGGEGFEWVEPDQDPAELLWRQKMEAEKTQRIGAPYTRPASEPDPSTFNAMPHASLIENSSTSRLDSGNAQSLPSS